MPSPPSAPALSSPRAFPRRGNDAAEAKIVIEAPQQGALSLGCTHIDERALQRFRSFVGRRMRAFGTEHLHYGDPRGSRELRAAIADHLLSARGLRCDPDQIMLTSGTQHALADRAERDPEARAIRSGAKIPATPPRESAIEHCGYRAVSRCRSTRHGIIVAKGRTARAVRSARPM